jgi:hypothetical protein
MSLKLKNMTDLTRTDRADMIEGIKRRPEKKWKQSAKLSNEQKLIDELVESDGAADVGKLAKKYETTSLKVVEICKTLGIY